jgi:hypothetical protein
MDQVSGAHDGVQKSEPPRHQGTKFRQEELKAGMFLSGFLGFLGFLGVSWCTWCLGG